MRAAKADGVAVTAEVAPHHLALTEEALRGYDPVFKVNPPLRTAADVEALKAGLADGTIDAIATDHAPHPVEVKERPIDDAPPGMLGLETALGVALAVLDLPLVEVVAALSWRPAAIAGVGDRHGGPIASGGTANLVVFDPDAALAGPPGGAGQPQSQLPVRRDGAARQGPPHRLPGRRRGRRRGCTAMNGHTLSRMSMRADGVLVLADGSVFEGELFGARGPAAGEVVFNTAMAGYQEILTDPSYAGQIITFTNPHIGNCGVNATDFESARLFCRGIVVRELSRRASNRRSEADLEAMLVRYGIPGITGIDTRRLTRLIRETGAIPGAFGPADRFEELRIAAAEEPGTDGIDLVAAVTTPAPYTVGSGGFRIVAYDYGIKRTILRNLAGLGTVEVMPASTPAVDVVARDPDGIFLSNGPGDPAEVAGATEILGELLGTGIPIFGICLGNQLLGRALGGDTVKLPFGHHGANHPVKDLTTGVIEITSQNHNFAVAIDSLADVADLSHVNLNDGVCEGLAARDANAFSVQHHPEAGPGPHDSRYLFTRFLDRMTAFRGGRIRQLSAVPAAYRAATEKLATPVSPPASRSRRRGSPDAAARRPAHHPRDRVRADRDRAGVRVRLLRHPGLPRAARRGIPGRPRQLQPGDDHDRPRLRRPHLHRAAHGRRAGPDPRPGAT